MPEGDWLNEYIHPEDRPHVSAEIAEAVKNEGVFELEHRVRRVDGTWAWTLSRAVPLLDDQGEVTEWFGAARDVTARRVRRKRFGMAIVARTSFSRPWPTNCEIRSPRCDMAWRSQRG